MLEQMQKLGLFADGSLGPGQLQSVMAMLNKQGMRPRRVCCLAIQGACELDLTTHIHASIVFAYCAYMSEIVVDHFIG